LTLAVSPESYWEDATQVSVVPWVRNERSAVTGLKTTSYAENVVALDRAHQQGSSEAIFANGANELCEGTGSNIFVVRGGELLTPPLSSGCLAGITRELVLEWTDARETTLALDDLQSVDEAFLTSSTRDVQPIRQVVWPDGTTQPVTVGPVAEKTRQIFAERAASDIDP
jgi:branched-chain amino acid aminotransferase